MAATHPRAGGCSTEPRPPPFPSPPAFNRSLFPSHFYAFFFLFPPFLFPLNPLLGSARGLGRRGERKKRGAKAKPKFVVGFLLLLFGLFFGEGDDDDNDTRLDASPDVHQPEIGPSWAALRRSPRAPQRSPALNIAAHTRTFLLLWVPNFIFFFPW